MDKSLIEKKKFVKKGKTLNANWVEFNCIKKWGKKEYRKFIQDHFKCSTSLVSKAFNGQAPYMLYSINQLLASNNGANKINSKSINNSPKRGIINAEEK